jgi:PPOX class probable F420-dependent enzyme
VTVPPEVDEFLASHTRTMLVTLRADGSPTVHPMLGLWRDGALWFNTYRKSAKSQNIERDPRVCCLVLGGDDDIAPPAVVVHGVAELMPSGTTLPDGAPGASPVTAPGGVTTAIVRKVEARVASAKRVLLRVAPERVELVA